jgi:cytoskeletal protein RodZ
LQLYYNLNSSKKTKMKKTKNSNSFISAHRFVFAYFFVMLTVGLLTGWFIYTNQTKSSHKTVAYAAVAPQDKQAATSSVVGPAVSDGQFSISSVSIEGGSWTCLNGKIVIQIKTAVVKTANQQGGSVDWRIETQSPLESFTSRINTDTLLNSEKTKELSANPSAEYIYETLNAKPGQSVRVHVTSPNSIYSEPFAIPDDASCKQ